ncbi:MAG: GntR family transcriptional regulator [Rhodospirillales bacterium]|nr:GntR family transcriptional regulator [Rhodospirillales bacterium]
MYRPGMPATGSFLSDPGFAPIARDNLAGRVYEELRTALMEGRLWPGQRLKIRELAAALHARAVRRAAPHPARTRRSRRGRSRAAQHACGGRGARGAARRSSRRPGRGRLAGRGARQLALPPPRLSHRRDARTSRHHRDALAAQRPAAELPVSARAADLSRPAPASRRDRRHARARSGRGAHRDPQRHGRGRRDAAAPAHRHRGRPRRDRPAAFHRTTALRPVLIADVLIAHLPIAPP